MKKVLVIGSTVADIIIRLNKLPTTGETSMRGQKMSLGGCAFNVSQAIDYFGVPTSCILRRNGNICRLHKKRA